MSLGLVHALTGRGPHARLDVAIMIAAGVFWGFAYGFITNLWFWPFVVSGSDVAYEPGPGAPRDPAPLLELLPHHERGLGPPSRGRERGAASLPRPARFCARCSASTNVSAGTPSPSSRRRPPTRTVRPRRSSQRRGPIRGSKPLTRGPARYSQQRSGREARGGGGEVQGRADDLVGFAAALQQDRYGRLRTGRSHHVRMGRAPGHDLPQRRPRHCQRCRVQLQPIGAYLRCARRHPHHTTYRLPHCRLLRRHGPS